MMNNQTFFLAFKRLFFLSLFASLSTHLFAQSVIFYDGVNYTGKSKSFGVGTHELKSKEDLNNLISSVKIPENYVLLASDVPPNKGKNASVDLINGSSDLSALKFDNKISYISIFYIFLGDNAWEPGAMSARGQFVPGHWERKKTGLGPLTDLKYAGTPTKAELDQFKHIKDNQMGVAVLEGETTKPFYFHHDDEDETVYKYKKEVHDPIFKEITKKIDAWFPVEDTKKTICGISKAFHQCEQDFWHDGTVNLDIDANLHIKPDPAFSYMLQNPRMISYANKEYPRKADADKFLAEHKWTDIECEFMPAGKGEKQEDPKNPMFKYDAPSGLSKITTNSDKVCAHGPWMWERLLYSDWPGVNLFKESHYNNEIHPVNQLWYKNGNETTLIAIVDGTGLFDIKGNGEIAASGLGQRMTFHVAFEIPASLMKDSLSAKKIEYYVSSVGFDYTDKPSDAVKKTVALQYKGKEKLNVTFNFLSVGNNFTWRFDQIRVRGDNSIQGYIVLETEPITLSGGSINLFVKKKDP